MIVKFESEIDCDNYVHNREELVNLLVRCQEVVHEALYSQW